jgi:putative ABC transport system permease protein
MSRTDSHATAPRLALWLLSLRVPEPDREYLIGDLLEAFDDGCTRHGARDARRWFWRETLHLLIAPWPAAPSIAGDPDPEASMISFLHSIRLAFRSLTRAPALTVLVVFTLALGIGATTSVYSVARAALFAAPPYPDSDRLALVWERDPGGGESNVGFATYQDLSREDRVFESTAAMSYWTPTLSDGAETTRLSGQRVTWRFFEVLGVTPMLGRSFLPEEDQRGANLVLILSHNLWRSRFGADSSIVDRDITVNGVSYRVAGVLPPTFESLVVPGAELWAPLGYDASLSWACRSCRHLRMIARLRADNSPATATQQLDGTYRRLREQFPTEYAGTGTALVPLQEFVVRDTRPALIALLAAVGLVALIACFNAANLLLSRALRREGEFATRLALGASSGRLATLLLSEGLLIALAAGALGSLLALVGVDVVVRLAPEGVPRLDQVRVDAVVFMFAFGLALFTGLAASVLPAWALLRGGLHHGIRAGARSLVGSGRHRLRGALVAAEVALAVLLVSGTSLLLGSVTRLLGVNGGFSTANRLSMQLDLSGPGFADSGSIEQAWRGVLDAVQAVPGVRSAALASQIPLGGNVDLYGMHLEDRAGANPADDPYALRYAVTPRYLETMEIPVRSGRAFTDADRASAPSVALLNEAAANQLFPAGNAIGRRMRVGGSRPPVTIVGIVGNTLHRGMDARQEMQVYVPSSQWGEEGGMTLVVHTVVRSETAIPSIRRAVRRVVPGIAISRVATLERLMNVATADRRFALALFASFAGVALVLATAGLYGVLAATVVERTREIGVRTALGASRGSILAMVVRQGMLLTGLGLAIGLFATWGSTRVISTLLFGVGASDPLVLSVVISSLGVAALLACALPAWRASRVDPVIALRDS